MLHGHSGRHILGLSLLPAAIGLAAAMLGCSQSSIHAQGYSPDEAPRRMTLPPGFAVELVAGEPLVRQPVAIDFDDAGRLWVIQYLQYPNPAGLKRSQVDRYSRTTYDRVPEPPPHGPQGADKITILEDTDGDGRMDRAKDFVTGLNLASGFAFGHGGLFVLQVPYLLFYADRDRDDAPDGDPLVLLSGFGMEDAHSVANSLTWGPDGWLYGCQGSTVTAHVRGIEFQQGVWRYHPISRRFELFCEGGGNAWGLDFDAHGNLFYATNYGGYAMVHGVQGAYYWKQFGKHGALHNPYTYGYFDHVPHEKLRGGHVTVGGLIYQADLFPPEFRGKYIGADLLGHAVYWHELRAQGSTFAARQAGDLLLANDTWFAPSDMTVGPDGAIYVCDWHDQRMAHPDPDAQWDRTNGRIFRISSAAARQPAPRKPGSIAELPSEQLVTLALDTNETLARKARQQLAARRDASVLPQLKQLAQQSNAAAVRALWTLTTCGGFDDALAQKLLSNSNPDIRAWTVRLLGDENQLATAIATRLTALAADEPDVRVRCQLACTAKRLPPEQALPIIRALVARGDDAADPYIPLLLWWAVEQHAVSARDDVVAMFCAAEAWQLPLVRDAILERLMRRYAAEGSEPGYKACTRLLAAAPQAERLRMLAALDSGLQDRGATHGGSAGTLFANLAERPADAEDAAIAPATPADLPPELQAQIDRDWRDDTCDLTLIRLNARLGRAAAHARAISLAGDRESLTPLRVDAIRLLGEVGQSECVDPLLHLLSSEQPPEIQQASLDALAAHDDPRIGDALLQTYANADPPTRGHLADVLLGRKPWARQFLAAIDRGDFPAEQVAVDQLRVMAIHDDAELDALVKKHWGRVHGGTPEERLAEMRRINNDLRAGTGDAAVGKPLFAQHCGTCHRLHGEGNQIGPELTHANRKNTDELLNTIVDPSAVVRREYLSYVAQTNEGRVLTGLVVEQSLGSITLLDAKNQRTLVPRDRIETLTESPSSLMPENILGPLQPQELRDLFAYLQSEAAN
ncbi:MAG: PVC-type heme-binding CxxCH protein [Pirellulales bacterium]